LIPKIIVDIGIKVENYGAIDRNEDVALVAFSDAN